MSHVITSTPFFVSSSGCAYLSPSTRQLLLMFWHFILSCPSSYCIPLAIIKCRTTILISYFPCLTTRFSQPEAQYTVRVSKLLLRNCIQAHDNCLEVLPHINLYFSTRRPRTIGPPGHVTPSFWKFLLSKNSVFQDQNIFSKNRQKIIKKKSQGCTLHPLLMGLRPSHKLS